MQEPHNPSAENTAAVPVTQPQPINPIETLTPFIVDDNIDEFNRVLITPLDHYFFLKLLEIALEHRAEKIITALSRPILSEAGSKSKSKLINKDAKTLLHLVSVQYAEVFHSSNDMLNLQAKFLKKIYSMRNKELILAAISGKLNVYEKLSEIPELPPKLYCPLIVYAAANNQVAVVRYLHEHNQNPHQSSYHRNAMIAAIINNATAVFDYLVETRFDPDMGIHIEQKWPCKFLNFRGSLLRYTVCYKRLDQFRKLLAKGAKVTAEIINFAIEYDTEDIAAHSIENSLLENLPSGIMNAAIRHGQTKIIRLLHKKGVSINEFEEDGICPLFSAIIFNKIKVVQELLFLNADITATNKNGANVLSAAAQFQSLDILEYLLEKLKISLTTEKLVEFLNTKFKKGQNILGALCGYVNHTSAWENYDHKKLTSILTSLVEHGTALFEVNEKTNYIGFAYPQETKERLADISVLAKIEATPTHILNFLAANSLLQKHKTTGLTPAYLDIAYHLWKYFSTIAPQYFPNITALKACLINLHSFTNYKDILTVNSDLIADKYTEILELFCYTLASGVENTCAILPTFVDGLNSQSLQNLAHTILLLPNFIAKSQLCLAIADRIYALVDASNITDPQIFNTSVIIAMTLYCDTSVQQNEIIAYKIKICDETLGFNEFSPDPTLQKLLQPTDDEKKVCNKILLEIAIKLNCIWLLDYIITDSSSVAVFSAISLHFLQLKDPNETTRTLIGKLLNKLTGNTPRRLLILAHALSHFRPTIAQPEQIKTFFIKALAQLADLPYSESDTAEHLTRTNPKEILIAILKIRVEFVKLLTANFHQIESSIDELSSLHDSELLSKHNIIIQSISQIIQKQKTLPTIVLDKIEQCGIKCLNQSLATKPSTPHTPRFFDEERDPKTGKRLAPEDITGASPAKHAQDERHKHAKS